MRMRANKEKEMDSYISMYMHAKAWTNQYIDIIFKSHICTSTGRVLPFACSMVLTSVAPSEIKSSCQNAHQSKDTVCRCLRSRQGPLRNIVSGRKMLN